LSFKKLSGWCLSCVVVLFTFLPRETVAATESIVAPVIKPESSTKSNRVYKGDLSFTLQNRRFDDPVVKSQFSRIFISVNLEAMYRDWLQLKFGAIQMLTSGQASNLYAVTEGGTGNALIIDEAALYLRPFTGLRLTGGIVKQDINPVYSLFYTQSDAGVIGEINKAGDWGMIALIASQGIPTSKGTSNRVIDEDTLPLLTVGTLAAEFPIEKLGTKLRLAGAHFTFTDLSSQAAADSQQTGSSTVGNSKGGFLFAYQFRGQEVAASLEQKIFTADKLTLKASQVKNELAPDGFNKAWQTRIEYNKAFNKWNLIPSMNRFYVESDVLPSVYSLPAIGFTNRQGIGYGLKIDFPTEKINVFGGYTQALIVNTATTAAAFQGDREIYTIGAEAKYDIF
jgi:hypothetical protein